MPASFKKRAGDLPVAQQAVPAGNAARRLVLPRRGHWPVGQALVRAHAVTHLFIASMAPLASVAPETTAGSPPCDAGADSRVARGVGGNAPQSAEGVFPGAAADPAVDFVQTPHFPFGRLGVFLPVSEAQSGGGPDCQRAPAKFVGSGQLRTISVVV